MLAVPSKAVFGYIGNITNMATLSCSWIMIVSYIYILSHIAHSYVYL